MCYAGSVAGAIVSSLVWSKAKSVRVGWLALLYWGSALFGIIDHLLSGELFIIPDNIAKDLLLGAVITLSIFLVWLLIVLAGKNNPTLANHLNQKMHASPPWPCEQTFSGE